MKTDFKHKQSVVVLDTPNVRGYNPEGISIGRVVKLDLSHENVALFNKGGFAAIAIDNTYCTNYLNTDVRKATADEIKRGHVKGLKLVKLFKVGNYRVDFLKKGKTCVEISVGCQSVNKKLFMAIGEAAGWIEKGIK